MNAGLRFLERHASDSLADFILDQERIVHTASNGLPFLYSPCQTYSLVLQYNCFGIYLKVK